MRLWWPKWKLDLAFSRPEEFWAETPKVTFCYKQLLGKRRPHPKFSNENFRNEKSKKVDLV